MSLRPLTPALLEKARKELNEDENRVPADLQSIKDRIAKQPYLNARTDDQWLIIFLRGCKFSLEKTKEKLDTFYSLRSTAADFYLLKYYDQVFQEVLNMGIILVLPKTAGPDAPRVVLIRVGLYDASKYSILDIMAVSNVIYLIMMLEDDHATVAGNINVLDLEGFTMAHFLQMTLVNIKKMVAATQDASPLRMKGLHYLNTPTGFETLFNTMKGFFNEKYRSRLFVHNKNYEALYKHIPKDILPAEYGGIGGTVAEIIEHWKNKVKQYSSWLDEEQQYGTDESKRPGKPKTSEDIFGFNGSFRRLELD